MESAGPGSTPRDGPIYVAFLVLLATPIALLACPLGDDGAAQTELTFWLGFAIDDLCVAYLLYALLTRLSDTSASPEPRGLSFPLGVLSTATLILSLLAGGVCFKVSQETGQFGQHWVFVHFGMPFLAAADVLLVFWAAPTFLLWLFSRGAVGATIVRSRPVRFVSGVLFGREVV